jgi:hypothetical protein
MLKGGEGWIILEVFIEPLIYASYWREVGSIRYTINEVTNGFISGLAR